MKRLLFDMSSVLWQCLLAGKDTENGREVPSPVEGRKPVWVNSAEYGFENFVNSIVSTLEKHDAAPRQLVMVFDGKDSKILRTSIYPEYKAGRSHHPDSYIEFDKLRTKAQATLRDLGALACWQDKREADDVMAYLAKNLKSETVMVSNDGDMLVLENERCKLYTGGTLNVVKYGIFPVRFITLYKALVGDATDNIKGAAGFGEKAFLDLYVTFGDEGLDLLEGLIQTGELERLAEDLKAFPRLQKIIDSKEMVYTSYNCARLYPEKVNTFRQPMQISAGGPVVNFQKGVHDERLRKWYGMTRIVHAGNYDEARNWALAKINESDCVTLDIETSTPEESDEWLEAKNRATDKSEDYDGVDQLGSTLTGLGLTFGHNQNYSLYFTVDHVATPDMPNLTSEQVRKFVGLVPQERPLVIHNAAFELPVLYNEWGAAQLDNGWHGFLPNVHDTQMMKSHVDENTKQGLKFCSSSILGYEQTTYEEVTKGRKMNQLTARETVAYGLDDTICTAALYNYFQFVMELEDTWRVYMEVDRLPRYLNALRFVQGLPISMERLLELEEEDQKAFDEGWAKLRTFLIANGWEGTVCPEFTDVASFTPAAIKEAFLIVTGEELKTQVRTPAKLVALVKQRDELLASLLTVALETGDVADINTHIKNHFKGEPEFNADSTPQMNRLLYESLGLPTRLRNKPTDVMRAKGIREGNPRTDALAMEFALTYDADTHAEAVAIVKALQAMKTAATRSKLYYKPYKFMRHWKDNLVHAHMNQNRAATKRYTSSDPNLQQLPKHPKQGKPAKFREVVVPHKRNAVVVSMDFSGQELRVIAERSQDANLLACYVGENKKDMHSLTGIGILTRKQPVDLWRALGNDAADVDGLAVAQARWKTMTYADFAAANDDKEHPDHKLVKMLRNLGKKTNFTTEYGAQAPKLAETLIVTEAEAKTYIDAKYAAFPRSEEWKKEVIVRAKNLGYNETMMGGRRHLPALRSEDRFEVSRAERQAVNNEIQGSCAEMTKKAEARLWEAGTFFKFDARYYGPVHDELVASVAVEDLWPFLREMHDLMIRKFADMRVPIISSISFGRNYGEQLEVGEVPDRGEVNRALQHETLKHLGYQLEIEDAIAA